MNKIPAMKENEFSIIGKVSTVLLIIFFAVAAVINIWRNHVPNPYSLIVALIGFGLFIAAKIQTSKKARLLVLVPMTCQKIYQIYTDWDIGL